MFIIRTKNEAAYDQCFRDWCGSDCVTFTSSFPLCRLYESEADADADIAGLPDGAGPYTAVEVSTVFVLAAGIGGEEHWWSGSDWLTSRGDAKAYDTEQDAEAEADDADSEEVEWLEIQQIALDT